MVDIFYLEKNLSKIKSLTTRSLVCQKLRIPALYFLFHDAANSQCGKKCPLRPSRRQIELSVYTVS